MSSDYYVHPRPFVNALFLIACVVMCCVIIWADLLLFISTTLSCFPSSLISVVLGNYNITTSDT